MALIFLTGGTGFVGRALGEELIKRGHSVRALVRAESKSRVPYGCETVTGDPLDAASYREHVAPADTFVHLVGVSHPSPSKAAEFRRTDLGSAKAAVAAARYAGVRHFVYVSVAHPAPVMQAYIAARTEAEEAIRQAGINATILRPWYIMGPGRRWPLLLTPIYGVLSWLPATRESAERMGLVTLAQMVAAMVWAIEQPAAGVRVVEVPQIRKGGLTAAAK